jgi:hypothetical protein
MMRYCKARLDLWALVAGVLFVLSTSSLAAPTIMATPNPVPVPPGQTSGTTTLSWDGEAKHPYAEVWVGVDGNDETFVVEKGKGTRQVTIELGKTYIYKLADFGKTLASVTVTAQPQAGGTVNKPDDNDDDDGDNKRGNVKKPKNSDNSGNTNIYSFAGTWETHSNNAQFAMTLQQTGNAVTGTYTPGNGKLEGTVKDNILRFKWSSDSGGGSGRFITDDGEMIFSGSYSNGDNPDNVDGLWIGTRKMGGGKRAPSSFAGRWKALVAWTDKTYLMTFHLAQAGDKVSGTASFGAGHDCSRGRGGRQEIKTQNGVRSGQKQRQACQRGGSLDERRPKIFRRHNIHHPFDEPRHDWYIRRPVISDLLS